MWISFPIGGRLRMGAPFWFLPIVLIFYAFAVIVWLALLVITAPIWLLLKLIQALTTKPKPRPRRVSGVPDTTRITITIPSASTTVADPPQPQRPGEIG